MDKFLAWRMYAWVNKLSPALSFDRVGPLFVLLSFRGIKKCVGRSFYYPLRYHNVHLRICHIATKRRKTGWRKKYPSRIMGN